MLHGPESKGSPKQERHIAPGLPNMKPSTGHVLYIEDDEDTRELVKYALGMNNYKVIAAANLEDALRLARMNQFDLYLIDNWMSGGSGIELCKKLREFDTWTPILFYSGAALERDKQEATAAGAQGYLVKPAGPDEVIAEIIRIVSAATRIKAASSL
jgi:two-component system OmpR family response regulator